MNFTLKTIKGPFGEAWQFDIPAIRSGRPDAMLSLWAVKVPWANGVWDTYTIGLIHLRSVPGLPPARINWIGATHEVFVHALATEYKFDAAVNPRRWQLNSVNYVGQFREAGDVAEADAAAVAKIEFTVEEIVNGDLSPDTDYGQHWLARFGSSNLKCKPEEFGRTVINIGAKQIVIDPAPKTKKPKDTLCRFCKMPAVAVQVVGSDACFRCAIAQGLDMKDSIIGKLMRA